MIMQGLLADYATADVVMNSRTKNKRSQKKSLEELFREVKLQPCFLLSVTRSSCVEQLLVAAVEHTP